MDQTTVLAGLQALCGGIVSTPQKYDQELSSRGYSKAGGAGELSIESLFKMYHETVYDAHGRNASSGSMQIKLTTLTGKAIIVSCDPTDTVESVKLRVHDAEGLPPDQQRIVFAGKELEDDQTLADYKIQDGNTLFLVVRLKGGGLPVYFTDALAPEWNYDFRSLKDEGLKFTRGGKEYKRPCGWYRYALKVTGRYENDAWLGSQDGPNEWPVSYHGTGITSAADISKDQYDIEKQNRALYGSGIYSTPDVEYAATYSKTFELQGKQYRVVLQNRVDPSKLKVFADGKIFTVPNGKHIRAYGVLIKEI